MSSLPSKDFVQEAGNRFFARLEWFGKVQKDVERLQDAPEPERSERIKLLADAQRDFAATGFLLADMAENLGVDGTRFRKFVENWWGNAGYYPSFPSIGLNYLLRNLTGVQISRLQSTLRLIVNKAKGNNETKATENQIDLADAAKLSGIPRSTIDSACKRIIPYTLRGKTKVLLLMDFYKWAVPYLSESKAKFPDYEENRLPQKASGPPQKVHVCMKSGCHSVYINIGTREYCSCGGRIEEKTVTDLSRPSRNNRANRR